jgi:two-component sensor histidine kinase
MLDGALGDTTAEQRDFLSTMDGDIDRLTELINNMLDISKIEAGRMRLFRQRAELPKLIESVRKSYQSLLGAREVRIEARPDVAPVFGDSHRLTQVFTNLLSNAVKFTPNDGRIVFRFESRNGQVAVKVEDNGPGISPEDFHRLFQKFSQVGQPLGGAHRGTGLGLVVCKELTELHGGRIEIASTPGTGTTFTVLLPSYTDEFALSESFREQLQLASGQEGAVGVALVAIDAGAVLQQTPPGSGPVTLEQLTNEVRQHLHRGDTVLPVGTRWVVALSAADVRGASTIAERLRVKLRQGSRLRFGVAVHPGHGADGSALFAYATQHMNQDPGPAQPAAQPRGPVA